MGTVRRGAAPGPSPNCAASASELQQPVKQPTLTKSVHGPVPALDSWLELRVSLISPRVNLTQVVSPESRPATAALQKQLQCFRVAVRPPLRRAKQYLCGSQFFYVASISGGLGGLPSWKIIMRHANPALSFLKMRT